MNPAPTQPKSAGYNDKSVVLQIENPITWKTLLDMYVEELKPRSGFEYDLVRDIAAARWRLRRCGTIETGLLDDTMEAQAPQLAREFAHVDPGVRLARAFSELADERKSFNLLTRYQTGLRREYHQALAALRTHRSNNAAHALPNELEQRARGAA